MKHRIARKWVALTLLAVLATPMLPVRRVESQARGNYAALAGNAVSPAINDTITPDDSISAVSSPAVRKWCAESTGVFNAGPYSNIVLFVHIVPPPYNTGANDTASVCRIAVLYKCISDSLGHTPYLDSLSTYLQPPTVSAGFGSPSPPAGTGIGVWPGEIDKTINPWIGRSQKSNQFYGTGTTRILLTSASSGSPDRCSLAQVRIRVLSYTAGRADAAHKPLVQAWVMGFN